MRPLSAISHQTLNREALVYQSVSWSGYLTHTISDLPLLVSDKCLHQNLGLRYLTHHLEVSSYDLKNVSSVQLRDYSGRVYGHLS